MIVLDIETTGLSEDECGICQISMLKVDENFNIIDEYNKYIKPWPGCKWSNEASNINNITPEKVKDCPTFKELAGEIIQFLGDYPILTYNGDTFDLPFLTKEFQRAGITYYWGNRDIYDSYYIETKLSSRKLVDVYKKYTGKTMDESGLDAHNSLSDVKATLEVFKHQKDIVNTEEFKNARVAGILGTNGEDWILLSGKYKDIPIKHVIKKDPNYLAWLIKKKNNVDLFSIIKQIYEQNK